MKKQSITAASIPSAASNAHLKGLQQYFTPEPWATALGAAWPEYRHSLADLHCGNGSLLRGLANDTTREVVGNDLDPDATLGGPVAWRAALFGLTRVPLLNHSHGDILDLYPLLVETGTRFDLLALNPPFSLNWPLALIHEPLRKGMTGKTIDSTHATLRMMPQLLTDKGEGMLIANQSTLKRLKRDFPQDFEQVWLHLDIPSFFPGVDPALRIGVLYFTGQRLEPSQRFAESWDARVPPGECAEFLDRMRRRHFTSNCIEQPWDSQPNISRSFITCTDEMSRRRDPQASHANVTLDTDGKIRTWVSAFQEKSAAVPKPLIEFLRSINRKHPLELTLQRGARMALTTALDAGIWSIDVAADTALREAIASFDAERAPLTPVSSLQRIGWIDDAEELLCVSDFAGVFEAGTCYPLSTETIEWKKEEIRPRYHAGKRDTEQVLVRGTDLRLTLHPVGGVGKPVHFIFQPDKVTNTQQNIHSLEILAAHFQLPEVNDITTLQPERFAAHLALLDELEELTS